MSESKMSVTITSSSHDCDCCGFFSVATANILYNGESYEFHHDGHFGNGYWNGDDDTLNWYLIAIIHGKQSVTISTDGYTQFIGQFDNVDAGPLNVEYVSRESNLTVNIDGRGYDIPYTEDFFEFYELVEFYELDGVPYKQAIDDNISDYILKDILAEKGIDLQIESTHEDCYTGYNYDDTL